MTRGRILVCDAQLPFAEDPWSPFVETLIARLGGAGFEVDLARIPADGSLEDALIWRLLDLSSGGGVGVDLLLALRFPTWAGRHPRKVVWTLPDEPPGSSVEPSGDQTRFELAHRALGEARRVFAATPAQRDALARRGLETDLLTPPPAAVPEAGGDPWPAVVEALTWIL